MVSANEYSLLLLAGGQNSRMGQPKPELVFRNKSFLDHMLDKGHSLGIQRCYISGYATNRQDVTTVWDIYPDRGPLGGLHACMKVMQTPYCLVLPVDAPTLPMDILVELLKQHQSMPNKDTVLIWEHGDRKEPLIAVYPVAMAATIEELIRPGSAPVFRALDRWEHTFFRMELARDIAININTPELYQAIIQQDKNDFG